MLDMPEWSADTRRAHAQCLCGTMSDMRELGTAAMAPWHANSGWDGDDVSEAEKKGRWAEPRRRR